MSQADIDKVMLLSSSEEQGIAACRHLGLIPDEQQSGPHRCSLEQLYHFRCGKCDKWWSIADYTPTETITCPHCAYTTEVAYGQ